MNEDTNLARELRQECISTETLARVIGVKQPKSALEKVQRKRPFKLGEARRIHKTLFPKYDMEWLFEGYYDIDDQAGN